MKIPLLAQVECTGIWIVHYLERFTDLGTNINKRVIYAYTGQGPEKAAMTKSAGSLT
jgi:hypothetical protein